MAYTVIDFPAEYFNTALWTVDGTGSRAITTGHSTDMVWIKFRDFSYDHRIYDDVRGVTKKIITNKTDAESTTTDMVSFDTNGFTVSNDLNTSGEGKLVGWSWKANGAGVSNTSGTITSTVSANTTSGFSIVSYTGNGTAATVGHGLGVAPKAIMIKSRSNVVDWVNYFSVLGADKFLKLNLTNAVGTSTGVWNNTAPTSSVFSIDSSGTNNDPSVTYIAYCFAEIKGYSKFGKYTGNGSTDGTFTYTGFKPAFVMIKRDFVGYDWLMFDNKRQTTFNTIDDFLYADLSDAEVTGNANQAIDFVSNGFKCRGIGGSTNGSGGTFIYMAFAESPFTSSKGIPTTAR